MAKKEEDKKITDHIEKIVMNTGIGKLADRADFKNRILPDISEEMSLITGQKPSPRASKKSIAGFSVREGDTVGLKTTLRGKRMVDFLIKLNGIVLPRMRDFKGIDLKNVDKNGNLNIGFKDQSVFPEINMDKSRIDFSLQVTIIPKENDREEVIEFYRQVGVPLKVD